MRQGPLKAGLVASAAVFVAAFLVVLLHHNTVNGRALTAWEQLPMALIAAVPFSALALLGTWLGLRTAQARLATYRAGLTVALIYFAASILATWLTPAAPQTVTVPSPEAAALGLQTLVIGVAWGFGVPYLIALLVGRLKVGC